MQGFEEYITKPVTHSCDGGSDLSSLPLLKERSVETGASSFSEAVVLGCGASIIIEFRTWKHSQRVACAGISQQRSQWAPSYLEFGPQENLTVRQGSVQRHPLVQDQLRFGEQLSHGDHKRSHWLVPCTGKLHRNKNTIKVKGEGVCGTDNSEQCTEKHRALTFTISISSLGS